MPRLLVLLLILPVTGWAQDDEPVPAHYFSAADSSEARLAALWLSGDLTPPDTPMRQLLSVFSAARAAVQEEPRCAELAEERFSPNWLEGEVSLLPDLATFRQIEAGTYRGWDQLPPELRPDSLDFTYMAWEGPGTPSPPDSLLAASKTHRSIGVTVDAPLHPARLAERYAELPGIEEASRSLVVCFDRCPSVGVRPDDESFLVVFELAHYSTFRCLVEVGRDGSELIGAEEVRLPDWWRLSESVMKHEPPE